MLQIFRLPNLFIVTTTQFLLQYMVLAPALNEAGINPKLDVLHFSLLVLTTVLIAAGGYLINDIIDYKTDLINKPDKVAIDKYIPKRKAIVLYYLIGLTGASIAWYLSNHVGNRWLFLTYPSAVLLLYLYSFYFKKMPLWGNVVVSLFCAGVAGIVLFSERESFIKMQTAQPLLAQKITVIFFGYIIFAFLSTFLRELIKDMEDIHGDKQMGLRTFPIIKGIDSAKILSITLSIFLLAGLLLSIYWLYLKNEMPGLIFTLTCLVTPVLFIINCLNKSELKIHYSTLSKLTKWVMLSGLLLLIIIWKF